MLHFDRHIFAAFIAMVVAVNLSWAGVAQTKGGPPVPNPNAGQWSGDYNARVIGAYTGTDVLKVNRNDKFHVLLKIQDASGSVVTLNVPNLDIVDGHFSGDGNIGGIKVHVDGRFDTPAAGETWKMRFCCNYRDENGKSGRIIGFKPN